MKENKINKQATDQDSVTEHDIHMDEKDSKQADLVIDKKQVNDTSMPNFGQKLRDERIKRGMNIAEVAHQLRLSEQQIQAIEEQNFSKLPAAVFLRGYIRNYANLLQLDDKTMLVEAITQPRPAGNIFTSRSTTQRFKAMEPVYQSNRGNRGGWLLLYVVVILVAFAAYGLYYEEMPEEIASASSYMLNEADRVVQPNTTSGDDQAAVELALPFSPTISESSSAESPASTGINLPSIATILPDVPVPSAPAVDDVLKTPDSGKKSLHFVFSKDSWVKIKDSNGQVILEKINPRGSEQTVEGEPPLYLVIGNAAGVSLTYNGNKVNLGPYTRNNDDVARFSLE
jgi:cytoskeleton protein RodZ